MRVVRAGLVAVVALGLIASARWSLRAQDERAGGGAPGDVKNDERSNLESKGAADKSERIISVQDALERPFILPFGEPTRLDEVCRHLRRVLQAPVVLDRAALERQEVRPEETVELELHGVRLKTGLKLLLDQVGLTYRVVAEDNLLIITDDHGAEDPYHRVLAELKALHRDLHSVQDAVDELRAALETEETGPKMRKPTIIEDMPEEQPAKKAAPAPPASRPRS